MKEDNLEYTVNQGEGAFYGPKIDIKLKDALKRQWQCATIQCDFALPKRFALSYVDSDGLEKQPIMLHRVLLGSLERFIGALIENYKGAFPVWLAPVQVLIIPINDSVVGYSKEVEAALKKQGIRGQVDTRNETLDKRIRNAEIEQVPYVLVLSGREEKQGTVSVRRKGAGDKGVQPTGDFIKKIKEEIENKI